MYHFIKTTMVLITIFFGFEGYAQVISKVDKKKRRVTIDQGTDEGFKKGKIVCFYQSEKRITCGKIISAKEESATVRIKSKKRFKRLKVGQEVRLRNKEGKNSKTSTKSKTNFAIKGIFLSTIFTPFQYNDVAYALPEVNNGNRWKKKESRGSAVVGGGLELSFYGIATGFRMTPSCKIDLGCKSSYDTDYSFEQPNQYARSEQEGSSLGFWVDYHYYFRDNKSSSLLLAAGIDADLSTVELASNQLDDNDAGVQNKIVSATSTATIISLRVTPLYTLKFGPLGIGMGLPIFIPLTAAGQSFAASGNEGIEGDTKNLEDTIAHGPSSFGIGLHFDLSLNF